MESEKLGGIEQLGAGRWKRREQRRDGGRGTKRELVQEILQVGGEVWRPYTQQSAKRRGEVTLSILLITYKTRSHNRGRRPYLSIIFSNGVVAIEKDKCTIFSQKIAIRA